MNKKSLRTLLLVLVALILASGVSYWAIRGRKSGDRCQQGIKDHLISQYKNPVTGETRILSNLPGCQPKGYELDPNDIVD